MTQQEFMRLADTKRELEQFLKKIGDEDFDAIGITDKGLIERIVEFLQAELEDINKKIEEL